MSKPDQKFVKSMYGFISKCKPLWKGVPTTCLKNESCAVGIVTKCFDDKTCRDGAAVKIGHCISAAGKQLVTKTCKKVKVATLAKVCEAKTVKSMIATLKQQAKVVGKFIKIVLIRNVPSTCRAHRACFNKADAKIKDTMNKLEGSVRHAIFQVKKSHKK